MKSMAAKNCSATPGSTSPATAQCSITQGTHYRPLSADVVELSSDTLDQRTDEEIATQLSCFQPVRQERNVWAFWDNGFSNLQPWTKRNIIGWVRRLGGRWDVRCVDMLQGSPNNVTQYIGRDELPECLVTGNMDGQFAGPHASDLARLALMYHHGGLWLDNASMIFCDPDEAFWDLIEDPQSPYEFLGLHYPFRQCLGQISTSFFAAKRGNPLVKRWMEVFHELWRGRTNAHEIHKHPLIQHLQPLAPTVKQDIGMGPLEGPHKAMFMDYLALNFAFERVRLLHDPSEGWNGLEYFAKHVLLVDALDELLVSYVLVPIEQHGELLALPYEPFNEKDKLQVQVRRWMHTLTSTCIAAKFSSSYWQPGMPVPLPKKWESPHNLDADIAPGSWAEYLRYASEHFTQRRFQTSGLPRTHYVEGAFGAVFKGRLLEPIDP